VRFDDKNIYSTLKNALAYYNAGVVDPGPNPSTVEFTATTPALCIVVGWGIFHC
jgi:hypothetical protein